MEAGTVALAMAITYLVFGLAGAYLCIAAGTEIEDEDEEGQRSEPPV